VDVRPALRDAPAGPAAIPAATAAAAVPPTLLLVDDEDGVLSALRRLFRRDGYRILTARSGAEGLALLAQEPVDVILSDQRMPGMSGVDFLRQAKLRHPDTVRMTLSGYAELQSIIDAVNEGAVVKFLIKPWDDERLREHIAGAFRHKAMADDNRRLSAELGRANGEMAALNRRLQHMLEQQCEHAALLQDSAGGVHELLDSLPVAVLGLDPDGLLVYTNGAVAGLLPTASRALGAPLAAPLAALLPRLRVAAASGGLQMRADGRDCRAWLRPMPARDGRPRGEALVLLPLPPSAPSLQGPGAGAGESA
jgi:CheY-like chemotaxis protein